jgi:KaiC/GvpD/RAD55 family RecA-like ATPase
VAPPKQRHCFFVIGSSGTGKTHFCAQYAKTYLREHPGNHVVLICSDRDELFEGMDVLHLTPAQVIQKEIKVEDLADCLIVFDDIGNISNMIENKVVHALANECLERSRKFRGDIFYISHSGSDYKKTKTISIECNYVWFNLNDVNKNLMYTLEKFGLPKNTILQFIKNKERFGRWMIVRVNSSPRYLISPLRCAVLDQLFMI